MRHSRVSPRCQRRAGLSRLEVFVILLTIIAFIWALGNWAFFTREPVRRAKCKNNLKQWGLALQSYHDSHGCFPPYAGGMLQNGERLSGSVMLLPFLNMAPLWQQIVATPGQGGDPMDLALTPKPTGEFEVFVCPSSTVSPPVDGQQHLSYVFCAGDQIDFDSGVEDFPNQEKTRGAFGWRHCRRVSDIQDGTSNTAFMAERDLGYPGRLRDIIGRVAAVPATSPADCLALTAKGEFLATTTVLKELRGERWSSGHPFYSVFVTALPPNAPSCAASAPPSGKSVGGWFTASSRHDGGCHVLQGDGYVRFVNEKIDTGNLNVTKPGEDRSSPYYGYGIDSSYGVWGCIGTIGSGDNGGISF